MTDEKLVDRLAKGVGAKGFVTYRCTTCGNPAFVMLAYTDKSDGRDYLVGMCNNSQCAVNVPIKFSVENTIIILYQERKPSNEKGN